MCSLALTAQRIIEPIQLLAGVPIRAVSEGETREGVDSQTAARIGSATCRYLHRPFIRATEVATRCSPVVCAQTGAAPTNLRPIEITRSGMGGAPSPRAESVRKLRTQLRPDLSAIAQRREYCAGRRPDRATRLQRNPLATDGGHGARDPRISAVPRPAWLGRCGDRPMQFAGSVLEGSHLSIRDRRSGRLNETAV
jgi:hypothetical protein